MSKRSKQRKAANNKGKGRVDQTDKRKRSGLGKRIVQGVTDISENRQQAKTERVQARQQSYADRTQSKAQGGKWTPESVDARWSGIASMSESIANAAVEGISAYYGGGYASAFGGIEDVLGGMAGNSGVVTNPEMSGPGNKGDQPRVEDSGGVMAWASENPLLAGGIAVTVVYVVSKAMSKRKAA